MNKIDNHDYNLHCHCVYCGHATGEVSEYVEEAKRLNLKVLGFSDHCPFPNDLYPQSRMPFNKIDSYISDVKEQIEKEKDLKIFLGFECDWEPQWATYFDDLFEKYQLDYAICSIHYAKTDSGPVLISKLRDNDKRLLHQYTDRYTQALCSGKFLFGAHPDLFGAMYHPWDDEAIACSKAIISAAIDQNMPLEINGLGITRAIIDTNVGPRHLYPIPKFFELAATMGAKIIVNSDSHKPAHIRAEGRLAAEALAVELGISLAKLDITNNKLNF